MLISEYPAFHPSLLKNRKFTGHTKLLSEYDAADTQLLYSGRNAVWHAVKSLELAPNSNVLMPSYHCSVEVEAALQAGARVKFFAVDNSLLADLEDIKQRIDANTKAVFIIHYFGFPQPIYELKQICEERGLYLVEDCAHAFLSSFHEKYLGTFGDLGVLSLQKFLPLPDGGALITNNPHLKKKLNLTMPAKICVLRNLILKMLSGIAVSSYGDVYRVLGSPLVHLVRILFGLFKQQMELEIVNSAAADFQLKSINFSMSGISKRFLTNIDLQRVVALRRANYEYLVELIKDTPKIAICFPRLPEGVCPCFMPIKLDGNRHVHSKLQRHRVSTFIFGESLHKDLPGKGYDAARYLSGNILALPIHQDLTQIHMEYMALRLRVAVEESFH